MHNWISLCTLTVQKFNLINRWKHSYIICGLRQLEKWAGLQDEKSWEQLICYKLSVRVQTFSQLNGFYSHCSRIFPFQQNSKWNSARIKLIYNGKLLEDLEIPPDRYNELNELPILSLEKWQFWGESFHPASFLSHLDLSFFVGSRYHYSQSRRLSLCFFRELVY